MLSLRATVVLCGLTLLMAAWTCWAAAPAGAIPAFFATDALLAAHLTAGFAIALAAFAAPLIFSRDEGRSDPPHLRTAKSALAALWLGVAAAFMMLAGSRVSPVSNSGIAQAGLWIAFTAWLALELEWIFPRAAAGLFFFWIVALPICAYMLAEVFLVSPAGGSSIAESSAPQAAALRQALHWILNLSPGTAAVGALNGTLADGSAYSSTATLIWMGTLATAIIAPKLRGTRAVAASKS